MLSHVGDNDRRAHPHPWATVGRRAPGPVELVSAGTAGPARAQGPAGQPLPSRPGGHLLVHRGPAARPLCVRSMRLHLQSAHVYTDFCRTSSFTSFLFYDSSWEAAGGARWCSPVPAAQPHGVPSGRAPVEPQRLNLSSWEELQADPFRVRPLRGPGPLPGSPQPPPHRP